MVTNLARKPLVPLIALYFGYCNSSASESVRSETTLKATTPVDGQHFSDYIPDTGLSCQASYCPVVTAEGSDPSRGEEMEIIE